MLDAEVHRESTGALGWPSSSLLERWVSGQTTEQAGQKTNNIESDGLILFPRAYARRPAVV